VLLQEAPIFQEAVLIEELDMNKAGAGDPAVPVVGDPTVIAWRTEDCDGGLRGRLLGGMIEVLGMSHRIICEGPGFDGAHRRQTV